MIGQPGQNALLSVTYLFLLCLSDDQWMADGVIGQPGHNALLSVTYLYLLCLFDGQWMADGVVGQPGQNALLSVVEPDNSDTGRAQSLQHVPQEARVQATT